MIKTVIFDMDGLLIDSKPIWQKTHMEILNSLGVPLKPHMMQITTGLRTNEVVDYSYEKYPWKEISPQKVSEKIDATAAKRLKHAGKAKKGVTKVLNLLKAHNITIGLASSSKMQVIESVLERFKIRHYFSYIHSAEYEQYGKPHPGVYISTMRHLGSSPTRTLAFEDSANGVLATKAAKMKCAAIPEKMASANKYFHISDLILDFLEDFKSEHLSL